MGEMTPPVSTDACDGSSDTKWATREKKEKAMISNNKPNRRSQNKRISSLTCVFEDDEDALLDIDSEHKTERWSPDSSDSSLIPKGDAMIRRPDRRSTIEEEKIIASLRESQSEQLHFSSDDSDSDSDLEFQNHSNDRRRSSLTKKGSCDTVMRRPNRRSTIEDENIIASLRSQARDLDSDCDSDSDSEIQQYPTNRRTSLVKSMGSDSMLRRPDRRSTIDEEKIIASLRSQARYLDSDSDSDTDLETRHPKNRRSSLVKKGSKDTVMRRPDRRITIEDESIEASLRKMKEEGITGREESHHNVIQKGDTMLRRPDRRSTIEDESIRASLRKMKEGIPGGIEEC